MRFDSYLIVCSGKAVVLQKAVFLSLWFCVCTKGIFPCIIDDVGAISGLANCHYEVVHCSKIITMYHENLQLDRDYKTRTTT